MTTTPPANEPAAPKPPKVVVGVAFLILAILIAAIAVLSNF